MTEQIALEARLLEMLTLIDEMPIYSRMEAFEVNSYPDNFDTLLDLLEQVVPIVEQLYDRNEAINVRAARDLMYEYGTRQGLRTLRHNIAFTHNSVRRKYRRNRT